ncbi:MAG TPA: VOC family protein [Actinomycetota bacterium]|nr:VOC family protein [Actinomycetota bacterium]
MLDQFSIRVRVPGSDTDRAKEWYRQRLGLSPKREHMNHLLFELGSGTQVVVYPSPATTRTAKNTQAEWTVEGIESVMDQLRSNGIRFEEYDFGQMKTENGLPQSRLGRSAWFKDNEGNTIQPSEPAW